MNLSELIDIIKSKTEQTEGVNSCLIGDVYEMWGKPNIKYVSVCWNLVSIEPETNDTGDYVTYNFIIYCGDRLNESENNLIQIWDYSTTQIQRIFRAIKTDVWELSPQPLNPFKQAFNDCLAGVYCPVSIRVETDINDCNF